MASTPHLDKEDVQKIAADLKMREFTDEEIQKVIDEHDDACADDPTGTWDLVVEQQLYSILDDDE